MRQFAGVRAALCWYYNESNKLFSSVTGACCETAALTGGLKRSPSPWKTFEDNDAQYKCEHCGRMVRRGDAGARYHLRRSKKAGGDLLAWYCLACGDLLMDLSSKFIRGHDEFVATDDLSPTVAMRMDIGKLLSTVPIAHQIIMFEVSQADVRDWTPIYKAFRRRGVQCHEMTLRRMTHGILANFERALCGANYIRGKGEYGVDARATEWSEPGEQWVPHEKSAPRLSSLDARKAEVMKGLDASLTQDALAEKLGVTRQTLSAFLCKHHEWIRFHGPCTSKQAAREFSTAVGEDEDLVHFITMQAHAHWQRLRVSYPDVEFEEVYAEFLVAASGALPQFEGRDGAKRETFLRLVFNKRAAMLERDVLVV